MLKPLSSRLNTLFATLLDLVEFLEKSLQKSEPSKFYIILILREKPMNKQQSEVFLHNGIHFIPHSITQPFDTDLPRIIPKDLPNCLADPTQHPNIFPDKDKIYLGVCAKNPEAPLRYPLWLPHSLLFSHILIGGSIGSGKTTVLLRLIAGITRHNSSIVISEAKAGTQGTAAGAAFTDVVQYLKQRYPHINLYRWPRGNCWFNPLAYLKRPQDRRSYFSTLADQITEGRHITGDSVSFIHNAATIAELLVTFLYIKEDVTGEPCTFRNLVTYLKNSAAFTEDVENLIKLDKLKGRVKEMEGLISQLARANFFLIDDPNYVASRHGVNRLLESLEHEDLFAYSEPRDGCLELTIQEVLSHQSIVIVSQPLHDASSLMVGPLFFDSLLAQVIDWGPDLRTATGSRKKVVVILDETHRLPVGKLGVSGDFLREYGLGLIEVTPAIVDQERWEKNKHVYQTILSLTPGVPDIVELVHSHLPNFFMKRTDIHPELGNGSTQQTSIESLSNYTYQLGVDSAGVSKRSLRAAGRFTGLIQSALLDEQSRAFWVDFSDELLANINVLLEEALKPGCSADVRKALDYALGLAEWE